MSHALHLPDEVYEAIAAYAAEHGQTPEEVVSAWAKSATHQVEQEGRAGSASATSEDPMIAVMRAYGHLVDPRVYSQPSTLPNVPPYGSAEQAALLEEIGNEASDALEQMGISVADLVEQ